MTSGAVAAPVVQWVYTNHLGTPVVTTDVTGTAVVPGSYAAVGYPGQTRTLVDLYYNRYRDYDPTTRRYIQADPIGLEGGSNPFLYAEGNPQRYSDPKGTGPIGSAVGGVIGGGIGGTLAAGVCVETGPGAIVCAIGGRYIGSRIGAPIGSAIEDGLKACIPTGESNKDERRCAVLYSQIDTVVQFINRKQREQVNGDPALVRGHDKAIGNYARNLAALVNTAELRKCFNYNSDARRIIRTYGS